MEDDDGFARFDREVGDYLAGLGIHRVHITDSRPLACSLYTESQGIYIFDSLMVFGKDG